MEGASAGPVEPARGTRTNDELATSPDGTHTVASAPGAAGSVRSTGLIAAACVAFAPVAVVPVAVNVGVHAPASRSPCVTTWRTLLHTYESPGARAVERLHDDALSGPASATLARATLPVLVMRIHGATWSPSRPSAPPV